MPEDIKGEELRFSAYLWGIETKPLDVTFPGCLGFQPTYEELKPPLPVSRPDSYCRFQPTYEELKLSKHVIIICLSNRFQPTYEELKPFYLYPVFQCL